MSGRALLGRLPDRPARLVLASGEYPELAESLRRLGVETVTTTADCRLPGPVRWHPDMQACVIGGRAVVLKGSSLFSVLAGRGIAVAGTVSLPRLVYPNDVLCNVLAWDEFVLGNYRTADELVRQTARELGAAWIDVKQGYAACATALVDARSAITADEGIADQLEHYGIKVLRITPGEIRLPGYPYGFIGGCCGKLAPNLIAFSGRLDSHADGWRIREFLSERGIKAVELLDTELLDVGGFIPFH